jgi:thioesterase domain-containing protein
MNDVQPRLSRLSPLTHVVDVPVPTRTGAVPLSESLPNALASAAGTRTRDDLDRRLCISLSTPTAASRYTPGVVDAPPTLYRATGLGGGSGPRARDWRPLFGRPVREVAPDGEHHSIFAPPHVEALASDVRARLAAAADAGKDAPPAGATLSPEGPS